MTLPFDEIYSIFLSKITDYSFLEYDEQFIYSSMYNWLRSAISKPYLRGKFSTLSLEDTGENVKFELNNPIDNESDRYFVSEVLAMGMVCEWLEPQVKNIVNIAQMFSGKEEKYFSQAAHLKEIKDLLESTKFDLRKILRDYGYQHNSYIE